MLNGWWFQNVCVNIQPYWWWFKLTLTKMFQIEKCRNLICVFHSSMRFNEGYPLACYFSIFFRCPNPFRWECFVRDFITVLSMLSGYWRYYSKIWKYAELLSSYSRLVCINLPEFSWDDKNIICIYIYICINMFIIEHGHGKWPICRWFSHWNLHCWKWIFRDYVTNNQMLNQKKMQI